MKVVNERSVDCDSDLNGAVYSVLELHDNSDSQKDRVRQTVFIAECIDTRL